MSNTVLTNGLDFLRNTLEEIIINETVEDEDIKNQSMKYMILHLSSGIELVYKALLFKEHWTYIFADMNLASKQKLISGDFTSVNHKQIIDRLDQLCDIKVHQKDKLIIDRLRKRRNQAEHYTIDINYLALESLVHNNIEIILKFIAENLKKYNLEQDELKDIEKIKELLLDIEKYHEPLENIALQQIKSLCIEDEIITCPECLKNYLHISGNDENHCYFCGYENDGHHTAREYINNVLNEDEYSCVKDGGEFPLIECPDCSSDAFVLDYENNKAFCCSCGSTDAMSDFDSCSECGQLFRSSEDYDLCICRDCLRYKIEKDD